MHAILDAGRGTLTVPRRLVPLVMLLGTQSPVGTDPASLRDLVELERAGIAPDRKLHPLAARMLDVVTGPHRVITVETTTATSEIATIWIRGRSAVLGRPAGPDLFRLGPIEVGLLAFHLAQLVRISPRAEPPFSGSVTVPARLLDDLSDRWDHPEAVGALISDGTDPEWAEHLAAAHRDRIARWRVASLWVEPDGSAGDDEIIVLDAGSSGYWQILQDADVMGQITFVTRRFVDLMELLEAMS
jgi:hypothetical protein